MLRCVVALDFTDQCIDLLVLREVLHATIEVIAELCERIIGRLSRTWFEPADRFLQFPTELGRIVWIRAGRREVLETLEQRVAGRFEPSVVGCTVALQRGARCARWCRRTRGARRDRLNRLGDVRTSRAIRYVRTIRSVGTIRAIRYVRAIWSVGTIRAIRYVRSIRTIRPIRPIRALRLG